MKKVEKVTKSELIKRLTKSCGNVYHKDISNVVDIVLEEIALALESGQRVELRGFGAFSVRQRKARKARNPKTNEIVQLGERSTPYFRAGKEMRERVNNAMPAEQNSN